MNQAVRRRMYDDELHDRLRHLAVVREPVDFQAEQLKRLQQEVRDTRDP